MVPQTRLALIATLLLLFVSLAAQSENPLSAAAPDSVFIHARVDAPVTLLLPDDWAGKTNSEVVATNVEVLADSTIGNIDIIFSDPSLDSLAVQAIRQAPLHVATLDGQPVDDIINVTIVFQRERQTSDDKALSADSLQARRARLRKDVSTWRSSYQKDDRVNRTAMPLGVISENYHLWGAPAVGESFTRDNFTERATPLGALYRLQMWLPFYSLRNDSDELRLSTRDYKLAPTWSHATLGTGDNRMSHAVVTTRKGEMFGRRTLRLRGDFAAIRGDWTTLNETRGDLFAQAADSLWGGELELQFVQLSQEIPLNRLADTTRTTLASMQHHLTETTASYVWRDYTLAVRHAKEQLGHDGGVYNESSTTGLLRGMYRLFNQRLIGQIESDGDATLITLRLHGGWRGLNWSLLAQDGDEQDRRSRAKLRYSVGKLLTLHTRLMEEPAQAFDPARRKERAVLGGVRVGRGASHVMVEAGRKRIEQHGQKKEALCGRAEAKGSLPVGPVIASLRAQGEALDADDIWNTPQLLARVEPELLLPLPHDNHIAAGAWINWADDYLTPSGVVEDSSLSLDAYLRIGITRQFTIRAEAYNLTNAERLLGRYAAPTHLNVTIRWAFIN